MEKIAQIKVVEINKPTIEAIKKYAEYIVKIAVQK